MKTEELNLSVLNIIAGIDELKTVTKHISCKCKFDESKWNLNQWRNNDKCRFECKKEHIYEKDYIWNPSTCIYENGKCLASITDDSVITWNESKEERVTKILKKGRQSVKHKSFIFYFHFYQLL